MKAAYDTKKIKREPELKITALAVRFALATILIPAFSASAQETSTTQTTTAQKPSAKYTSTLPQVTVTPESDNSTTLGSTTTITSEQLEKNGVNDMAGIIKYQPLISAPSALSGAANVWDGTGTSGYNIRGIEGNRIGLDVDGIDLPSATPLPASQKASGIGIGRDYIDPEVFRQVDISSGTTSPGTSGATGLGGRVSFITKSPEDFLTDGKDTYLNYKLGYTSADRAWNNVITGAKKFGDWQALVLYSRRDGHAAKANTDLAINKDDWHSDALLTKLVYDGFTHHRIGLTLDMYQRKDSRYLDGATFSAYPAGADQTNKTRRYRLALEDEFTAGAENYALFDTLKTYISYQDAKKEDYTVAFNSSRSYKRYIDTYLSTKNARVGFDASKLAGNHHVFYGASLTYLQEERPWTENRYVTATGQMTAGYPYTKDYMASTDTTKFVAYVRDEIKLTDRAILTPGIRGEFWHARPTDKAHYLAFVPSASAEVKNDNTGFIAPSLNFSYALTPTYNAYIQYTRGARIPTAGEKTSTYDSSTYSASTGFSYAIIGNPNLKKETSNALEIGTKGEIARGVTLNTAAFYTKYKNFIEYVSDPAAAAAYGLSYGAYRLENLAQADIWGGEISTRFTLGEFASALQGYSVSWAVGSSHGKSKSNEGKKGSLNSVTPAKTSLSLGYDAPSGAFGGALTATYVKAKQANTDDVSATQSTSYFAVPAYTVLDLATYWNVTKNVTINAGIFNLTDKKYWDYATSRALTPTQTTLIERSAQPGRNFAINANITF